MMGDAEEVAHALERRPAVGDIPGIERLVRVAALEALEHTGIEIE